MSYLSAPAQQREGCTNFCKNAHGTRRKYAHDQTSAERQPKQKDNLSMTKRLYNLATRYHHSTSDIATACWKGGQGGQAKAQTTGHACIAGNKHKLSLHFEGSKCTSHTGWDVSSPMHQMCSDTSSTAGHSSGHCEQMTLHQGPGRLAYQSPKCGVVTKRGDGFDHP